MSAATVSRVLLRRRRPQLVARHAARRHASTTAKATEAASQTASAVKESASNATSKASQGLSRVTSSAGSGLSAAASSVSSILGRIGGRTGRLIAFVESLIPPTIYYSRVGLEISKLVFQSQKMTPPSISTVQSYLQPLFSTLRHPSSLLKTNPPPTLNTLTPETILNRIRQSNRAQLAVAGVVAAEILGFFTVGEMIGRMKLVGYWGDVHHHETTTPHDSL